MATTYMNLTLPTVDSTIGPTWANQLNTAITAIDAHDHSSGKGVPIPVAGININADLDMNNYSLSSLGSATFISLDAVLSTVNSLYVKSGDLYFTDSAGNAVRLTASGAINTGSVGGIGGDYVSASASLYYTDSTKKYTFVDSAAALAPVEMGAITASTLTVSGASTLSGATSFTGNTSGRGIVPVGGILPLMSHLTGITNVTATTAADANGYVVCGGQTIVDATSPMNGAVIPNINNSVFLMGSSTAGSTGGSNTTTLAEANLPAHTHTIDHGHSNTFALSNTTVPTSTHTHNIAHAHQWGYFYDSNNNFYTRTSLDDSSTTITNSNQSFMYTNTNTNAGSSVGSQISSLDGANYDLYTTGVLSPPTGSAGSTAASDTPSATQTVTLSGSVTSMTGNSGSTGSTSSYDSRPSYITAKYIIRIK
jgi:hypothetical protein